MDYHFTREFTSGWFEGITMDDTISFPTYAAFRRWVDQVNEREADPNCRVNYRIIWAEGDELAAQTPVEVF